MIKYGACIWLKPAWSLSPSDFEEVEYDNVKGARHKLFWWMTYLSCQNGLVFSLSAPWLVLGWHFSANAITDMAKTAAAKFGKILTFKLSFHNGGHGWAPTIARFEVE
jgi:hypothetical protein